jgi:hypothetical protein
MNWFRQIPCSTGEVLLPRGQSVARMLVMDSVPHGTTLTPGTAHFWCRDRRLA